MVRSPLVLAALATVAVPELDAVDVRRAPHPGPGFDSAIVIGADGVRWLIRAPQDPRAGAAMEVEVALLDGLTPYVDAGDLPFDVPRFAGSVALDEGGRAVVHPQLRGRPIRLEELGPGPGMAAALGRAIAAIHELPAALVEDAGLPVYDADSYRQRRLVELDEAAATGRIPTFLLRRWERALEDVSLWHFQPTVIHGDLSAEHVLCTRNKPVSILGWTEAKVADPADDLAWLLVAAPQAAVDPIVEAYHLRRTELRDPHLATRALLAGELAVVRWLLHGVHTDDQVVVDDATQMLLELEDHLIRYEEAVRAAAAAAAADIPADPDDENYENYTADEDYWDYAPAGARAGLEHAPEPVADIDESPVYRELVENASAYGQITGEQPLFAGTPEDRWGEDTDQGEFFNDRYTPWSDADDRYPEDVAPEIEEFTPDPEEFTPETERYRGEPVSDVYEDDRPWDPDPAALPWDFLQGPRPHE